MAARLRSIGREFRERDVNKEFKFPEMKFKDPPAFPAPQVSHF
jgi:hypothetical protein